MRLKSIKLKNFRGYQEECTVHISNNLTGVIGRNDVGKSTVLEALDIFLNNNEATKAEKTDVNIKSEVSEFELACTFDNLPTEIVIDSTAKTSLENEFLLNKDGCLEIVKIFKFSSKASIATYIKANQPAITGADTSLHTYKITELKKLASTLKINSSTIDERKSSDWRRLIFSNFSSNLQEKLIDISKGEDTSKFVFEKIQNSLPVYALFKSDRASSDVDPEAKDPLQVAVKHALAEHEEAISKIQQAVQERVLEVANRTLEKLKEMDPNLSKELTPKFKEKPKWTFNFTIDSDNGVPVNKRGSGVRRLILLNFFRAEAEKKRPTSQTNSVIYAIEEPETSQHPNYQRMLIESLLKLSMATDTQVILTTHVPALAGLIPIDGIRYITKDHGNALIQEPSDTILEEVSRSLGVLPEKELAGARAIILVEGISDITFLNHISEAYKSLNVFTDTLASKGIIPIPTGGCGNLKNWVTKNVATSLGLKWGVLMDSDKGTPKERVNQKHETAIKMAHPTAPVFLTKKREAENYICPTVVMALKGVTVTYTDTCDAKGIISDATTVKDTEVLETFWSSMSPTDIRRICTYTDSSGVAKDEFQEMLDAFLKL